MFELEDETDVREAVRRGGTSRTAGFVDGADGGAGEAERARKLLLLPVDVDALPAGSAAGPAVWGVFGFSRTSTSELPELPVLLESSEPS